VLQYHRAGHERRWRAVVEPLVAIALWVALAMVEIPIVTASFGVKKLKELPPDVRTYHVLAILALLGPASLLAARVMGRSPRRLLSALGRVRWRWLAVCLGVGLACHGVQTALGAIGIAVDRSHFVGWADYLPLLGVVLLIVPLQALGEELFYRGTLQQTVGSFVRSPWPGIVISTALFTVSHGLRPEVDVGIGAVGLCSAWLTIRTGGLEASTGYHVMLNVTGFALKAAAGRVKPGVNDNVHWIGTAISIAAVVMYTAIIARLSAKRLATGPDQIEQDPAERGLRVEHADHRGGAEPLPPEQQ
jgi:membrane protease YdiL (CAAX protease family)